MKTPPDGLPQPRSAEELERLLSARLPPARASLIEVVVLDVGLRTSRSGSQISNAPGDARIPVSRLLDAMHSCGLLSPVSPTPSR